MQEECNGKKVHQVQGIDFWEDIPDLLRAIGCEKET